MATEVRRFAISRASGLVLAALSLALSAAPARAHQQPARRAVVVQGDQQGVALLWRASVDPRAAALLVRAHDADGDGVLSGAEAERVAQVVILKAMRGVRVLIDGAAPTAVEAQARLEQPHAPGAALRVMGLVALGMPGTANASATAHADMSVGFEVEVVVERGEELEVVGQAFAPWRLAGEGPADRGAGFRATKLLPGQRRSLRYEILAPGDEVAP